ncbi:MAG: sulfotransferase [Bacteriovorax sp.]
MIQRQNDSDIYRQVLTQRKELRSRFVVDEVYPAPKEIDQVIVILGSSRSGSSLLHHLLSLHPEMISLQGEEVTFTKLFGMNSVHSFDESDLLKSENDFDYADLAQEILYDAGYNTDASYRLPLDRAQRLLLQWPHITFNHEDLLCACSHESWEKVISHLKSKHEKIKLDLYDQFLGPISSNENDRALFLEEPPFVVPRPKTYRKTAPKKILLLKSSINAFRAGHLSKLFPNARFKFIHLTRNPAASINGLMDGWLSSAFHSHNLGHLTKLSIKNYEDKNWWKFDLPPGWKDFIDRPLEEVCAFQWQSANESILRFLDNKDAIRIKYEEMIGSEDLFNALRRTINELSLSDAFMNDLAAPPRVMSVNRPHMHRWREREDVLTPLFQSKEIADLAKKLGYDVMNLDELK